MAVPAPPADPVEVKYFAWVEQRPFVRVCTAAHQPNSFNPTNGQGRFRPFYCGETVPVPTMYGASHIDAALGETVFHDVPSGAGGWVVPRAALYPLLRTVIVPQRRLHLVDLTGWSHKALRLEGRALVDCGSSDYPATALWAERFHELPDSPDGLYWRSRQYDRCFPSCCSATASAKRTCECRSTRPLLFGAEMGSMKSWLPPRGQM
jgi:hypothetical protein